jgi:transcriptional regulator with XRE-family HTH domain
MSNVIAIAKERGYNHEELGEMLGYSDKTISAFKTGRRPIPKETKHRLAEQLDDPRVYLELECEATQGAFGGYWLNGSRVDLHHISVLSKAEEELKEALDAIQRIKPRLINRPLNREEEMQNRIENENDCLQLYDAINALKVLISVICMVSGMSIRRLAMKFSDKLYQRGYIEKTTSAKVAR